MIAALVFGLGVATGQAPFDARAVYRVGDASTVDFHLRSKEDTAGLGMDMTLRLRVTAVTGEGGADVDVDVRALRIMMGEVEQPDPGFGNLTLAYDGFGLPTTFDSETDRNLILLAFAGACLPAASVRTDEPFQAAWKREDGTSAKITGTYLGPGDLNGRGLPKFETKTVFLSPGDPELTVVSTLFFDPAKGYVVHADGTMKSDQIDAMFTFRRG